jgi:hypothetical protein
MKSLKEGRRRRSCLWDAEGKRESKENDRLVSMSESRQPGETSSLVKREAG